ncbi:MAG: hypothetical protein NTW94_03220 [Legionellales bacterium]|nr:hypothetical protein [Legionellales bacterium]
MSSEPPAQMPSSDRIVQCSLLATTAEAARYFVIALKKKVADFITAIKMSPDEAQSLHHLVHVVDDSAKSIENAQTSSQSFWTGRPPVRSIPGFTGSELEAANKAWDAKHGPQVVVVDFGFGVTDQSEFVRSYSHEDQLHEPETIEQMDRYFKAWLDTKGMVCDTVEDGDNVKAIINMKLKNPRGQTVKANPVNLRNEISSSFSEYVKSQKQNCQVNSQDRSAELAPAPQAETTTTTGGGGGTL